MKKQDQTTLILGLAGIGLAYFGLLRPILTALGIQSTAQSQQQQQAIQNAQSGNPNNNPWSPSYWKIKGGKILTMAYAKSLAKRLHDAMGNFTDDEETVYGVLKSLQYKTQVSFLCDVFNQIYKADLFEYLKRGANSWNYASGLNNSELNECIKIVNSLK